MRVSISPPPGLVSDETTFATPGFYADGNNARFWQGKPQTIGGWTIAQGAALTGTCRNAQAWADLDAVINIAFGTSSALQVMVAGTLYDITPAGLTAGSVDGSGGPGYGTGGYGAGTYGNSTTSEWFARTWSLDTYGENLLASPRAHTLYVWRNDTSAVATEVAGAPDIINAMLMTQEEQVLACGCTSEITGLFDPMLIRGSKIKDYTAWAAGPAANDAFEHKLEGGGSVIVGAKRIGSQVAVWTDTSLWLGTFIGTAGQRYRFDLVANNCGLLGPNAVTVSNQAAYWITPDLQVYSWLIGSPPQPVKCPIRAEFIAHMDRSQAEKLVAVHNGLFSEVWFFYPDTRDGMENSRYIAVSTLDAAWFRGELARTAAIDAGPTQYPLAVGTDGYAYWHENGQSANGGVLTGFIETSDQYVGQAEARVLIKGIWPDFESQVGTASVSVNCRSYPQATVTTKGPYTLTPNVSKRDFLADTRIASLRFDFSSAPSFMRLGKPTLDVVTTGRQ